MVLAFGIRDRTGRRVRTEVQPAVNPSHIHIEHDRALPVPRSENPADLLEVEPRRPRRPRQHGALDRRLVPTLLERRARSDDDRLPAVDARA